MERVSFVLALRFLFEVPSERAVLSKIDNLRFGSKSNLKRDLRQMAGPEFGRQVFNNRTTLWAHIQSLFGRAYTIVCEPAESGAYTRITAIAPAANGASARDRQGASPPTLRGGTRAMSSAAVQPRGPLVFLPSAIA